MPPFIHLHVHSSYSDGSAHPLALIDHAKRLGYTALALTDHNSLDGHAAFISAARFVSLQPILGVELRTHLDDTHGHVLVLSRNGDEYDRLRWLLRRKKQVRLHDLKGTGIITTACLGGLPAQRLLRDDYFAARDVLLTMHDKLGDDLYVEIQPTFGTVLPWLSALARELQLPLVATNDVHHIAPSNESTGLYLNSPEQMQASCVLQGFESAMANSLTISQRCVWS